MVWVYILTLFLFRVFANTNFFVSIITRYSDLTRISPALIIGHMWFVVLVVCMVNIGILLHNSPLWLDPLH